MLFQEHQHHMMKSQMTNNNNNNYGLIYAVSIIKEVLYHALQNHYLSYRNPASSLAMRTQ